MTCPQSTPPSGWMLTDVIAMSPTDVPKVTDDWLPWSIHAVDPSVVPSKQTATGCGAPCQVLRRVNCDGAVVSVSNIISIDAEPFFWPLMKT